MVLNTTGLEAVGGEELRIEFTVTNEASEPAFGATLAFGINEPSRFVFARSARGTCEGSACNLGPFDGHESVTGHIVVLPKLGFDTEVRVDADLSWLLANSNKKDSSAQATAPLADDQPGALIWVTSTDARSGSCGDSVQVGLEEVYTGFGVKLYAVSRSSGKSLWFVEADSSMFRPVLADGNIYFHERELETRDHYVYSVDPPKRTFNWKRFVAGPVTGPAAVHGGSIFFTVNDKVVDGRSEYSYLLSLDASTGDMNWQYRVDKWINTSAVESGGNIYFGTYSGGDDYLYSIDPRSGELSRRYRTGGGSYYTPAVADGKAYIVSGYGYIYSMDLSTGKKDWEYLPKKGGVAGTPVLSDGNVYFRVYDREAEEFLSVHALDAATGSFKWLYRPGKALMHPTAADGSVYVPSYVNVVSLDAKTGSPNWQADYRTICGPLTPADGVLYGRATHNNRYVIFAIRAR